MQAVREVHLERRRPGDLAGERIRAGRRGDCSFGALKVNWKGLNVVDLGDIPRRNGAGNRESADEWLVNECLNKRMNTSDLVPLWLSLRVASLATALIVSGRYAGRIGPGAGEVSRQSADRWRAGPAPGSAADRAGLLSSPGAGSALAVGRWLDHRWASCLVFHWSGAVVASAVAAFPLFLLPARGAFEAVDPALEDAARLLGRGEISVVPVGDASLGLARMAAGMVLSFARALGDFGATLMVAGNIPGLTQTASLAIYDAVQVNDPARAGWLTLWISVGLDRRALVVQRTLPARGVRVE